MNMREYLETWDRNAPASFLTVGDVLAIYEKYDENPAVTAYRMEQEQGQEETPPADAEWLGESPDEPDGTEPSPIISGGEVLYRNYQSSDDIPF